MSRKWILSTPVTRHAASLHWLDGRKLPEWGLILHNYFEKNRKKVPLTAVVPSSWEEGSGVVETNNVRHIFLIGDDRLYISTTPSYGHPSFHKEGTTLGAFFSYTPLA